MDRYFPVIAKSSSLKARKSHKEQKREDNKFQPYSKARSESPSDRPTVPEGKFWEPLRGGADLSRGALTKHILRTLSDGSNPITHSDLAERSDRIFSSATGHQRSEIWGSRRESIAVDKEKRAIRSKTKTESSEPQVLHNARVYINGFLDGTTDIEMKRLVARAGGQIMATASGCTHILTSQHLSASKTQKILSARARSRIHVVKPEWVFDCINAGKKLSERPYVIIKDTTTKSLTDVFAK